MSVMVVAVDLGRVDAHRAAPYRAVYHALTARAPVVRGDFDDSLDARALSWVQASLKATVPQFLLHVLPVDPSNLPPAQRDVGFDDLSFSFAERGVRLDNACLARVSLPVLPHQAPARGPASAPTRRSPLWRAEIPFR